MILKKHGFLRLLAIGCIFIYCGCSKKNDEPHHEIGIGSLTVTPLDMALVSSLVPLGSLNPPGHTFPTDHMYLYYKTIGLATDILSMYLNSPPASRMLPKVLQEAAVTIIPPEDYKWNYAGKRCHSMFRQGKS